MGKTYAGAKEDMSDVIGTSSVGPEGVAVYSAEGLQQEGVYSGEGTGIGGSAAWRRRTGETPAQRLVRLREETAMLAEDLEEMSKVRPQRGQLLRGALFKFYPHEGYVHVLRLYVYV